MFPTSRRVQALALVAIGSLLGYAAASADRTRTVAAAAPGTILRPPPAAAGEEGKAACAPGELARGPLLALAECNAAVAAQAVGKMKQNHIND